MLEMPCPASQPASQPVPPFQDEPLAEAARMNKKERSRVLRAVWAVRSTSWASWAVPSGRGRCRSKRAGQILPVFVIAAPCWPSCPGARAAPDERERERACAFPPSSPSLILILTLFLARYKGIGEGANADLRGQNVFPYTPRLCGPHAACCPMQRSRAGLIERRRGVVCYDAAVRFVPRMHMGTD